MDKDNNIKPWVRNIVAMPIPFGKDGNYRFESKYDGTVTLTKQNWEDHILPKHPEVDLNWKHIEETLKDPNEVSVEDGTRLYYRTFPLHQTILWDNEITAPTKKPEFTVVVQISNKFILTVLEKKKIPLRHQQKEDDTNV